MANRLRRGGFDTLIRERICLFPRATGVASPFARVRTRYVYFWHRAADIRAATIRPLSDVIRKLAERASYRRL